MYVNSYPCMYVHIHISSKHVNFPGPNRQHSKIPTFLPLTGQNTGMLAHSQESWEVKTLERWKGFFFQKAAWFQINCNVNYDRFLSLTEVQVASRSFIYCKLSWQSLLTASASLSTTGRSCSNGILER